MIGQIIPETAWERSRMCRFTSSEISRLTTFGKRKMTEEELKARPKKGKGSGAEYVEDPSLLSTATISYVREKAAEISTGTVRQMETHATEWGKSQEPHAAAALAEIYPGIIYYGMNNPQFFKYTDFSGGSPDAEQSLTRVFEIKCPENPAHHEEYMDYETPEDLKINCRDHYEQLQMNMAVVAQKNGKDFKEMEGVFASFDSRYPAALQLHRITVPPDFDCLSRINAGIEAAEIALAERMKKRSQKTLTA